MTVKKLKKLNVNHQKIVYKFANKQLQEQETLDTKIIPLVGKTAANPAVLAYGDTDIEQQSFDHVAKDADCAINIQSDSMKLLINHGDIVFYKKQEDVEIGDMAIVEINGDGITCKKTN